MNAKEIKYPESLNSKMIAPCGMNCGVCIAHLREKNRCVGCNGDDAGKPKTRVLCRIKTCAAIWKREQKFCFECAMFPCERLRHLDKHYRTKYGMSMIENLENIRELGLEEFVTREKDRWKCPECGGVVCVHREDCLFCGRTRN